MSDYDDTPEKRRSPLWTAIAGAVLVVVVAMGAFLIFGGGGGDSSAKSSDPDANPGSSNTDSEESSDDPAASVCGLPGHDTSGTLTTPPKGATWDLAGQVAVPKSKAAGPGKINTKTGVRYCYAHTREGAVTAAANVYSWSVALKRDPTGLIERNVATGPGYDAAMNQAQAGDAAGDSTSDVLIQIRGFELKAYSDTSALVSIALQSQNGGLVQQPVELSWEKGDWRFRFQPDGTPTAPERLDSLGAYVPWAGA